MTGYKAEEVVERGLQAAGGRGCAVLVEETAQVNLRWALNGLTTNGLTRSSSVTVIVSAQVDGGTAVGVLTRQGIGPADVADLVSDAAAQADRAAPAEDAAPFADGEPAPGWDAPAGETDAATLTAVAAGLGEVFGHAAAQGRESFGFAQHEVTTTWLGTSGGVRLRHEQPNGTIELTGRATVPNRSTWVGRTTRDFADVDVIALDDDIATRLEWQRRRVDLPPGRYDTVLPPSSVADLMAFLFYYSDARSAHEGRTAFSRPGGGTRLGDRLSDVPLTLHSDPAHPGLESAANVLTTASWPMASVFDNGLPISPTSWLDAGVVAALPSTRHTARLTGLPFRPPAWNLVLDSPNGAGSELELVTGLDRGLLLTCLWYIREVDPASMLLTGLTRDGVYLVEGGEIAGAVGNYRFNESPVDLLGRVDAVGAGGVTLARELGEYFPRTSMPALRVSGFNMSTSSQAS